MTEAGLKGDLVRFIRQELIGAAVFRHEDRFTSGIPDISVTLHMRTSWWEVKFLNPRLISKGIQEHTLLKLDGAGHAFYVLYDFSSKIRITRIVHPRDLYHPGAELLSVPGFDHQAVVGFIRKLHGVFPHEL